MWTLLQWCSLNLVSLVPENWSKSYWKHYIVYFYLIHSLNVEFNKIRHFQKRKWRKRETNINGKWLSICCCSYPQFLAIWPHATRWLRIGVRVMQTVRFLAWNVSFVLVLLIVSTVWPLILTVKFTHKSSAPGTGNFRRHLTVAIVTRPTLPCTSVKIISTVSQPVTQTNFFIIYNKL